MLLEQKKLIYPYWFSSVGPLKKVVSYKIVFFVNKKFNIGNSFGKQKFYKGEQKSKKIKTIKFLSDINFYKIFNKAIHVGM